MAITKKDQHLKQRIGTIINQLKDKSDKEIIYAIAGLCKISHRTASEHFHSFKAQQLLESEGFKEKCTHDWSNAYSTAQGLAKECRVCHKIKDIKIN